MDQQHYTNTGLIQTPTNRSPQFIQQQHNLRTTNPQTFYHLPPQNPQFSNNYNNQELLTNVIKIKIIFKIFRILQWKLILIKRIILIYIIKLIHHLYKF